RRVGADRGTRAAKPRAAARERGVPAPAPHDDARRAVPLRPLGRPGTLSADERQLRPARAAGAAGEGQATEETAAGRAGAGGYGTVRGADSCTPGRRPGVSRSGRATLRG